MKLLQIFVVLIAIGFVGLWVYGFKEANDLTVPTKKLSSLVGIKKVLVIFPHPDDEAQSMGGTLTNLIKNDSMVDWVILTRGERGNEDAHLDESLKAVRTNEAQTVAKILGIQSLDLKDYPDNGMDKLEGPLIEDIRKIIQTSNPDLVVTYDQSGGYGHPDHIVLSKIVTELLTTEFPDTHLWYTSTPKKLFTKLALAEQMAKDSNFKSQRKDPSFKVSIGITGLLNKIKAVYAHQSQFASFVKSVPIKQIPMWFYISLTPYEYFHEVK